MRQTLCLTAMLIAAFTVLPARGDEPRKESSILKAWEATQSGDRDQRLKAIRAMVHCGDDGIPLLMDIWQHGEKEAVVEAARTLWEIKPESEAVARIVARTLASSKDRELREMAATTLGHVKGGDVGVDALIQGLNDPDHWVVYRCVLALINSGPPAKKAVPALVKLIGVYRTKSQQGERGEYPAQYPEIYVTAAWALQNIDPGSHNKLLVPVYSDALHRYPTYGLITLNATRFLGKLGADAREAIPALLEFIDSKQQGASTDSQNQAREAIDLILKAHLAKNYQQRFARPATPAQPAISAPSVVPVAVPPK